MQARSSGGEHHLDTVGVQGSNPCVPTIYVYVKGIDMFMVPFFEKTGGIAEVPLVFFLS